MLTLIDHENPHPLVSAAGVLVILLGEWERGNVMADMGGSHDNLFLKGGPSGVAAQVDPLFWTRGLKGVCDTTF